jgi:transcriptional regulator with XRE-family HTH domain
LQDRDGERQLPDARSGDPEAGAHGDRDVQRARRSLRPERTAARNALGQFLRARRKRFALDGTVAGTLRRRRTGLRREEVAARAGVSVTTYRWLEQGRVFGTSPYLIDRIANALELTTLSQCGSPERHSIYANRHTEWMGHCGTAFNGTRSNWDGNADAVTGYPCIDQPGRGQGDLLTGDFPSEVNSTTGTIAWPHQALEPIYEWLNTASVVPGWGGSFVANISNGRIVENWNTSNGSTNDGTLDVCTATNTWTNAVYTPYTYPHPLAR